MGATINIVDIGNDILGMQPATEMRALFENPVNNRPYGCDCQALERAQKRIEASSRES